MLLLVAHFLCRSISLGEQTLCPLLTDLAELPQQGRWREGSGSLHPVGRRFGSRGVRCDVAQVAIYFPRHGRVGAPGHHYGVCKRLCSVARGGKLCWAPMGFLAQLSWAVLWSLVPGTRGTRQDMILFGTVPLLCMFPSTWSLSKSSVGALVPQEGLLIKTVNDSLFRTFPCKLNSIYFRNLPFRVFNALAGKL